MQLQPFSKILAMSKEKIDEAMAPIRAKNVKAKADLEMAKLEEEILGKETKVQEMCLEKEINLPKLLDLLDEIAILEQRKDQYSVVMQQLFPTKTK